MRYVGYWLHEHSWDSASLWSRTLSLLSGLWLGALILALGAVAFITAVILAYPVVAHIAAKFFQ